MAVPSDQLYPYCFDRCVIYNLIIMYTMSLFYSDVLYWMLQFPRDGSSLALAALTNVARGHPISTYSLMRFIASNFCSHSPPTLIRRHDPSICLERQIRLKGILFRKFSANGHKVPAFVRTPSKRPADDATTRLHHDDPDNDCIVQGADVVVAMLGIAVVQRTSKIKRARWSERGLDGQH
jgi:hypothetical protein